MISGLVVQPVRVTKLDEDTRQQSIKNLLIFNWVVTHQSEFTFSIQKDFSFCRKCVTCKFIVNRLVTETSGCFTDKQPHSTPMNLASATGVCEGGMDVSRSTSNVFRSGDYNFPSYMSRGNFITTQKQDYQAALPAGVTTSTKKAYSHVLPGYVYMYVHVCLSYT